MDPHPRPRPEPVHRAALSVALVLVLLAVLVGTGVTTARAADPVPTPDAQAPDTPTPDTPTRDAPTVEGADTTGDVVALVRRADGSLGVEHFLQAAGVDTADVLEAVRRRPGVVAADVDVATRTTASDPYRRRQWALDTLRADDSWGSATGRGVTVAVLDTGVEARHPDLRHAVGGGADFTGSGGDGRTDVNGHGTHVAGIIAAGRGNGVGTAGLAPDARILPVAVLDARGAGKLSWAAAGLIWAVDHGADVVNLSLGATRSTTVMDAAVDYAVGRGVTVVAASGNDGAGVALWPAADPDVISVGAATTTGAVASFSNADRDLDVVAPGSRIISTCVGGSWCEKQGTSMATPFVTATMALLREVRPDLGPAGLRALLRDTATDVAPRGRDAASGSGALATLAALRAATTVGDPFLRSGAVLQRVGAVGDAGGVAAAVAVSRQQFPDGAATAVLGRADVFADALTGAALAGGRGPVLFTSGGPDAGLDPATAAELSRVLSPGATVAVLGGDAAVSRRALAEVAELGFSVHRVAGATRVSTATLVADEIIGSSQRVPRVLLARADHWADAVTGSAYAADSSTPILLTGTDTLTPAAAGWLADHDVGEVVVLGGDVAVSDRVIAQLRPLTDRVTRVSGADRAATAAAVAEQLWQRGAGAPGDAFVVVEGYGAQSWAPAVAAAGLSAAADAPQLLVASDTVPAGTRAYLDRLGYGAERAARFTAVGGGVGQRVGWSLLALLAGS